MRPIAHQSLAVHDMAQARDFYVDVLGCPVGRSGPGWMDVWMFGTQVTLHEEPDQVVPATDGLARHFGVTLDGPTFAAVMVRLEKHPVTWLRPCRITHEGTVAQQTKAMIADPSGNAIELKTYADAPNTLEVPKDLELW